MQIDRKNRKSQDEAKGVLEGCVMYGKHFSSMYEGSMVGAGSNVFAVWGYCIAKADPDDHCVLLNPLLLSSIIGADQEDIKSAIIFLCAPDEHSKNRDNGGRRLQHISGWSYMVVSHEHYRGIKNKADVREYERKRKQKQREKKNVPQCPGQSGTPASVSVSVSGKGRSKKGNHNTQNTLAKYLIDKTSEATGRKLVTTVKSSSSHISKLLEAGITESEIRSTIDWLTTTNMTSEYRFDVHSGKSLFDKWDKIQSAITRNKPRKAKPYQNTPSGIDMNGI